jgi:hypothetical protein
MLRLRFDALGDHLQTEVAGHRDHRPDDFGAACINLARELAVDLHEIEREAANGIEVTVLGAEIIDRKPDAVFLEFPEDCRRPNVVPQQEALGQFQNEAGSGWQLPVHSENLVDETLSF